MLYQAGDFILYNIQEDSTVNQRLGSKDLAKRDNTLQTLRYLLDGGSDTRYDEINNLFTDIACDTNLYKLLDGWYIGTPLLQANIFNDNSGQYL